ncbi:MAG: HAD family hydrolase [Candidatus Njordarchaeia archaeon]
MALIKFDHTAIIFDLDSTLIINRFYPYAFEYIIKVEGLENITPLEFRTRYFDKFAELIRKGEYVEAFDWDLLFRLTMKDLGRNPSISFMEVFERNISLGAVESIEGVIDFLNCLKKKDAVTGILTNGISKYQNKVLLGLGLVKYVDFVITSDMVGTIKPFREAFEKAAKEAEERGAKRLYFVGDNLYFDIVGALNYGFDKVFWFNRETDKLGWRRLGEFKQILFELEKRYMLKWDLEGFYDKEIFVFNDYSTLLNVC